MHWNWKMTDLAKLDDLDELLADIDRKMERTKFHEMQRSKQAGILCKREDFQQFVKCKDDIEAANYVRCMFGVSTRTHLNQKRFTYLWHKFVTEYMEWCDEQG